MMRDVASSFHTGCPVVNQPQQTEVVFFDAVIIESVCILIQQVALALNYVILEFLKKREKSTQLTQLFIFYRQLALSA